MAKQPEVGTEAPRKERSDEFSMVSKTNPMTFVAFYRGEVMEGGPMHVGAGNPLRAKPRVKVPASRACPDADERLPDGTRLCNFDGWSYDKSPEAPPKECPGIRYNGEVCGKPLDFKTGSERFLQFSEYQFTATNPHHARLLARKFPKDTDMADDFAAMNHNGALNGVTYPGKGRTWRDFLDQDILPMAHKNNPGRLYDRAVASSEKGEVLEREIVIAPRRA